MTVLRSKKFWFITISAAVVLLVIATTVIPLAGSPSEVLAGEEATVYRSPACSCCRVHEDYLSRRGMEVESKVISNEERMRIAEEYGIPADKGSCHTTVVGDYVVEGHMPHEVIEKLLQEKPDIEGITLPGMPTGSPGMPGRKAEPFTIYSFDEHGATEVFTTF